MYSLFHLKWRFMKPFSKLRAETRRSLVTEKETYELPLWALEIASSNANPKWNWLYDASYSTVAFVKKHMLFHIIIFHIMCVHMRTHTRTCAYIYTLICVSIWGHTRYIYTLICVSIWGHTHAHALIYIHWYHARVRKFVKDNDREKKTRGRSRKYATRLFFSPSLSFSISWRTCAYQHRKSICFSTLLSFILRGHTRAHALIYIYTLISRKGESSWKRKREKKKARSLEKTRDASLFFFSRSLFFSRSCARAFFIYVYIYIYIYV